MSSDTVSILLPELIVVLTATFIYVAGAFLPGKKFWGALALVGVAAAGFVLAGQSDKAAAVVAANEAGPLAVDLMGRYVRGLALLVGAIFVLAAARPQNESLIPEYVGTVLMAVAGLMLVGGARELTLLFLGLELISIPTYILLYLGRRDGASAESAAKYFFLSVLSSAVTLYGFSYLYGVGGSTRLDVVQAAMSKALVTPQTTGSLFAQLALVLIFAGLGFKIAAVPFHFYAPDVYQGTTHVNAGLLAVLPKIAGIAALVRIASIAMPGVEETGLRVTMILALLTMTLGNVVALWQNDVRRMLAYSSIAHAGYMLVGLAVDYAANKSVDPTLSDVDGVGAALFYVAVYSLATAGSFAAFAYLGGRDKQIDTLDDLAGVGRKFPAVALAVSVFMFSLTGLPPLAGFWGKFALFSGAVKVGLAGSESVKLSSWFIVLSIVGVLNAAVSAAYYLRIIGVMYFRESSNSAARGEGGSGARLAAFACALLVMAVGLAPSRLSQDSQNASRSARAPASASAKVADVAHVGDVLR